MDRLFAAELPRPALRHYRLVVISPHLDDAVFSCAARMAAARREGPVLVVNVFSRFATDVKTRGVVLGDHRHAEEAAAAQLLGFETLRLDALDVSFRDLHYRALSNIFGPPVEADLAWLPVLRAALGQVLAGVSADQLLAPLGVGWHVDHLLIHQLFSDDPVTGPRFALYEDLPYGLIPHAVRFRMNDMAAAAKGIDGVDSGLLASWAQVSAAFWRTAMVGNLQPWLLRQGAKPVVAAFLLRQMLRRRPVTGKGLVLSPDVLLLDEQVLAFKIRAMQCYASQFREFFKDGADCAQQLRDHASRMAAPAAAAERIWTPAFAGNGLVEESDTQPTRAADDGA